MSPISLLLNILWIVFGGLWMAVWWAIVGLILAITIIGLPWARSAFTIALYNLAPFGRTVVRRSAIEGHETIGTSPLGLLGNLVWLVLFGWWLALQHLVLGFAFACTIIGLPFAWAHLKLAGLSLWPVGMVIVSNEVQPVGYSARASYSGPARPL
ncbi:MAG: YccF domain-containing protein [Rhodospirillaceae bacterium]